VAPAGWRRARAMLHFDEGGELKRAFLLTAVDRNKNPQLRIRALQEIAAARDAEAFDRAIEMVAGWPRDEKREGVKVVLQALAEKKIGRRDQANNWIWACAEMTREVHEEYAVQRWPETKRLLGLLVNSSGGAHARNARRLVHAARQQDRRLAAALLAAALPHTAEAGEVINGARTRMSRKPAALARELLRNFPKGKGRRGQRRRKKGKGAGDSQAPLEAMAAVAVEEGVERPRPSRRRRGAKRDADPDRDVVAVESAAGSENGAGEEEAPKPKRSRKRAPKKAAPVAEASASEQAPGESSASEDASSPAAKPKPKRAARKRAPKAAAEVASAADSSAPEEKPKPKRAARKRAPKAVAAASKPKPATRRRAKPKAGSENGVATALERASERVREAVQADSGDEAA
jgi:ribonuclease E